MDFFANLQIIEYNQKFNRIIIKDCPCYSEYLNYEDSTNTKGGKRSTIEWLNVLNKRDAKVCIRRENAGEGGSTIDHKSVKLRDVYTEDGDLDFVEDCPCYVDYLKYEIPSVDDQDNKRKNIFKNLLKYGKKYAACIVVEDIKHHKVLPIMIGSDIDIHLRGVCDLHQSTGFILNGLQTLPNFLTNNLRGGHVYRPANIYKWMINEDRKLSHMIQYPSENNEVKIKSVTRTYRKRETGRGYEFNDEVSENSENDWINVVNRNNPIQAYDEADHDSTEVEYLEYFKVCIEHYPKLDDLGNKMIMTPSAIFQKVIDTSVDFQKQMTSKLKTMITGNLFYTLSATSVSFVKSEFKTAYVPIEGHRVSVVDKFASSLKRHISTGVRNSEALKFPRDAYNFICPINTKEMKNAGETMALAQLVVISPYIPLKVLSDVLKNLNSPDGTLTVVIEGWLTKYKLRSQDVITLKRRLILVTMNFDDKYLLIYHKGQLPIKYSPKYRMFVGPHEAYNTYKDCFEGYTEFSRFSSFALKFHKGLTYMPPEKSSVSLNNIKGTSCTLTTLTDLFAFIHSVGFSNSAIMSNNFDLDSEYITFHDESKFIYLNKKKDLSNSYKLAETRISKSEPIISATKMLKKTSTDSIKCSNEKFHLNRINAVCKDNIPCLEVEKFHNLRMPENIKQFFQNYDRMVQNNKRAIEQSDVSKFNRFEVLGNDTFEKTGVSYIDLFIKNGKHHVEYIKRMLNAIYAIENCTKCVDFESRDDNRIILYTALSNLNCDTVEDGVVLDETFCRNSPLKLFSVNLSLKIGIYSPEDENKIIKISISDDNTFEYIKINKKKPNYIIFGMLISDTRLMIQKRNSIKICQSFIKNTFRYLILMDDALSDPPKVIDSYFNIEKNDKGSFNASIFLHYHYTNRLGHGTKISNLHGQKGIVAKVKDLSSMKFWKRDGTLVHPQLLFSKQSLLGRSTSSQTVSMLNSEDLAINEHGEIVAPLAYFVHQIESTSRCKKMIPKNDLMTSENGFLSNGLVYCMQVLSNQYILNQSLSNNKMLIDLMKLNQCHLDVFNKDEKYDYFNFEDDFKNYDSCIEGDVQEGEEEEEEEYTDRKNSYDDDDDDDDDDSDDEMTVQDDDDTSSDGDNNEGGSSEDNDDDLNDDDCMETE